MISHTARSHDPSLAQAVGFVVLESAAAEDTMGELVVIRKGSLVKWWESGAELCEAVESLGCDGPAQLAARLRQLLPLRNTVVHSVWLEGSSGSRYTMKRSANTRRSPALPGYEFEYVSSLEELEKLADDFRQLEHLASREVAIAMGIAQS